MEVVDRVIEELRPVADKLGEGAEYLWETLIRQMIIQGVISIVIGIVLITVATIVIPRAYRAWVTARGERRYDLWNTTMITSFWIGLLPLIAAIFGFFHMFTVGIPKLINPSYYALQEILRVVN